MAPGNDNIPLTEAVRRVAALYSARRLEEASALTRQLVSEHPDQAPFRNMLGAIQAGLGELEEAAAQYRRAIALAPGVAEVHFHLGNVLRESGRREEALAEYRRALELKPDFVDAYSHACQELERANRTDQLRELLARARSRCPGDHPALQLREAELLQRDGDLQGALRCLESPTEWRADEDTLAARAHLLADLYDRLQEPAKAFHQAGIGNQFTARGAAAQPFDGGLYLQRIDKLGARFTPAWVNQWSPLKGPDGRADPVFLVGFPRSGTTLLDTILRSHPAIAVLEEKPTVNAVEEAVHRLPGGYPDALADLDAQQLARLRNLYFEQLDRHLPGVDRPELVVDKLPLNLVHAGLLHRVFPDARFLFAQRHPCDCVLSCYMRPFKLNEGMVNFLELGNAATLYHRVMTLWQAYLVALPLRVHTIRYEQLIANFDQSVRPMIEFLGLEWRDELRDYAATARARGDIDTPSYNQVTQPIYSQASGRWRHYREELAPVLDTLLPWAERMGYPSD